MSRPNAFVFRSSSMMVETDDDTVRRALTPTCPSIERRVATMRRARAAGVKVQVAVSPTLPHSTEQFAALLEATADRVVVDTFFGDGSDGRRTGHRPLPKRFAELGRGNWRDVTAAEQLFAVLRDRLGSERVGWSQQGFNDVAIAATAAAPVVS